MAFMRAILTVLALAILGACSSGPPVRVFPPQVTVQELRLQPDGRIAATLRVQNYSTVPMAFSRLQATLTLAGTEAARFDLDPAVTVGPGSNEPVTTVFAPPAAVASALAGGATVRYTLSGRIENSMPGGADDVTYSSALDPVPGLAGVFR